MERKPTAVEPANRAWTPSVSRAHWLHAVEVLSTPTNVNVGAPEQVVGEAARAAGFTITWAFPAADFLCAMAGVTLTHGCDG
jgi:hypothetical protein